MFSTNTVNTPVPTMAAADAGGADWPAITAVPSRVATIPTAIAVRITRTSRVKRTWRDSMAQQLGFFKTRDILPRIDVSVRTRHLVSVAATCGFVLTAIGVPRGAAPGDVTTAGVSS